MNIALVSHTRLRTPPLKYGGVELVVSILAEELHKQGHNVTLLASGDSQTSATLYPIQEKSTRGEAHSVNPELELSYDFRSTVNAADYLREHKFDIIHNHAHWFLLPFHKQFSAPVVTTCHSNYEAVWVKGLMLKEFKDLPFVSISMDQRRTLPELNYVKNIYHGIDLMPYEYNDVPEDYLLFLGRMSAVKDPVKAIKMARATNKKLIIAAKIDIEDEEYYKSEVAPLIDGDQIEFVGEVGLEEKVRLLRNAQALLSPVKWHEPFGLVNIEAMACGTPVIGSNWGSLPEIVSLDTGFLCDTFEELCNAVRQIERIERKKCRDRVEEQFSANVMARHHIQLYQELLRP